MSNLKTAAIFSNSCVLQRNKVVEIFGTTQTEQTITITLSKDKTVIATNQATFKAGKWSLQLAPQPAMTGLTLEIKGSAQSEPIIFTDVAFGEVWLCGGQSNMEFELQNCIEGPDALASTNDPNVRFYYTQKKAWMDDDFYTSEENTAWQKWDSDGKKAWSAVGFFFARKLAAELGITVGLVGCNWGGTSASAWINEDRLKTDDDLRTYLTEQEEATRGISQADQIKAYNDYLVRDADWNKRAQKVWAEQPSIDWEDLQKLIGKNEYPGPRSCNNPYRPCGLYQCMLQRIMPYTLKGVIWYQGESDDHKPAMYRKLFTRMIENWRTDWHDPSLPFILVQLPGHRNKNDPDYKHWPLIREAQWQVTQSVANTYMAAALDLGAYNDIHPKNKLVIGERLEVIAARKIYKIDPSISNGSDEICADDTGVLSPTMKSTLFQNGSAVITFDNASTGFEYYADVDRLQHYMDMEAHQGNTLSESEKDLWTGFEIAGDDENFVPARITFEGDKIIVSNESVKEPKHVRYSWYNYAPVTIFSKSGLPVAPFRV